MEISDLVRTILGRRGISSQEDIAAFLNPDYDLHTHDPFLMQGMDRAVDRLFAAIERGERIAVYADFDCDGIPGGALLSDFFKKIRYENVEVYLPHRDREGYGFHIDAITQLAARGVKLIITVDVGTTAIEPVAYAKSLGVDVIVTDHHEIIHGLPDAFAVLNPKLGKYPFRDLCGASTAFKFAQAALRRGKERGISGFSDIPDGWEKWLLDLVAIATIADMVPLVGENRVLTRYGLQVLRKSRRLGIDALCTILRMKKSQLTEDDIGFSIAPRINAASRMDEPDLALRLLTTEDRAEAEALAAQLEKLNASRKGVVGGIVREAKKTVQARYTPEERVVVVGSTEWKPALLGLAANSILAERQGVVCLWGRDAKGNLKGSCRADSSLSLVELFANARDVFEESGGHARSGGFSVSHERIHELPVLLKEAALAASSVQEAAGESPVDWIASLSEVGALFRDVSALAPFGIGNQKPTFQVSDVIVSGVKQFGKEQNHVEIMFECPRSGTRARGFDFFRHAKDFSEVPPVGGRATIVATIEKDSFRGGYCLRLQDVTSAR